MSATTNSRYGEPDSNGQIDCPKCGGDGIISGHDVYRCPLCLGNKKIPAPPRHVSYLLSGSEQWGFAGEGWYFWAEDEATCFGPYDTVERTNEAIERYAEHLNHQ